MEQQQDRVRIVAFEAVKLVDRAIGRSRHLASRALDRAQFELFKWKVALDPGTRRWINEIEHRLEAGELHGGATSKEDFERIIARERAKYS